MTDYFLDCIVSVSGLEIKRKLGAPCRVFETPVLVNLLRCFNHNIEYGDRAYLDTTGGTDFAIRNKE